MRLIWITFALLFLTNCSFSPSLEDHGYPSCGIDGLCPEGCMCLGEQVCVPFDRDDSCVDDSCECDDANPCTDDACDAEGNCLYTPNELACDDGDACTAEDTCSQGRCAGLLTDCEEGLLVGPSPEGCPHVDSTGAPIGTCDFSGTGGLYQALSQASAGDRIMIFDDGGAPFQYQGCLDVPGGVELGAAPGVAREGVVLFCAQAGHACGVLRLRGDGVHLHDLTLVAGSGGDSAVCAWPAYNNPVDATGGHLLENLSAFGAVPEWFWTNGISAPLRLGPDTTVRNSHFSGYFESTMNLGPATGSRLLFNTFVLFGEPQAPLDATDVEDLVLANNVFINPTPAYDTWIRATATTSGLVVVGNAVEGFENTVADLGTNTAGNLFEENSLSPVEAESPYVPRLLADSTLAASALYPGEGTSLDGVPLDGRTDLLPGAYQLRSAEHLPRRMVTRVGDGDCGGQACHIDQAALDEIQQAVWSTWPGGTVKIYPATAPYAGNAVISWSVDVVGAGSQPSDTVLVNHPEGLIPWSWGLWNNGHHSLLAVLATANRPMRIANLTLRLESGGRPGNRARLFEGPQEEWECTTSWEPGERHRIERVVVETQGTGVEHFQGLQLASRTRVQDSLIRGEFGSCLTFGTRPSAAQATPPSQGEVVNLTCRLTGTLDFAPRAAFEVASADGLLFLNLAVQLAAGAPLFAAQRRASGDDSPLALDAPLFLRGQAITAQNIHDMIAGFTFSPTVSLEVDVLTEAQAFFLDEQDSHLVENAQAMDSGIEPSSLGVDGLSAGTSLDGVTRSDRVIDRGAYEQGQ